MAAAHEGWIAQMFADLSPREVGELMRLLGKAKTSSAASGAGGRTRGRAVR